MSDAIESMRDHGNLRRLLRARYGKPCPECQTKLPRAHPSILLPQQTCRIHHYRDQRPDLTQEDYDALGDEWGDEE